LTHDFGYSDVTAGTIYGSWGAAITVYGLATGVVIDKLGVRQSLILGYCLSLISRCMLFLTTSRFVLLLNIGLLLPLGNCLGIPVLTIGIRRYTKVQQRGFAFGVFYVVMNVAALMSGPMVDICNKVFQNVDVENSDDNNNNKNSEWTWNQYRMVLLSGIIANAIAVLMTFTIREIKIEEDSTRSEEANVPGEHSNTTSMDGVHASMEKDIVSTDKEMDVSVFIPSNASAWSILKETLREKNFWRFLVVCLIMLNVRMIFRHLDATFPKYMTREFGDGVPYGTIYSINPAIIMVLVPIMTAATSDMEPLVMIHIGSYISAASVFFLAFSTSIPACVMFVVVLSIGEATWSPRLYDYTMNVCQEGREGTYMALSSAPLFLAKLPVGFMSGYLLQEYCPSEGERRSKAMWLIIGLTTATSPVLLTTFWKYISQKDAAIHNYREGSLGIRYAELAPAAESID